ncbi:hypothetical protein Nepgr_031199 [Nepenthes gracilis]|uniref:Uncharacterized protein n=1 Tax=Nepenthes gracilis TaxID=150966 RepID=A0AAD3Y7B4_NEPGR|nr:hypothetical protein Nepgr_031199 [Nepenthes gracilis]
MKRQQINKIQTAFSGLTVTVSLTRIPSGLQLLLIHNGPITDPDRSLEFIKPSRRLTDYAHPSAKPDHPIISLLANFEIREPPYRSIYLPQSVTHPTPRVQWQSSSFHSSFLKRTTDITRSHERPEYVAKYPSGSHHDGHGTPKNTTHMTRGPSFEIRFDTWRGKSTFAAQSNLGKSHSHHNHLQPGDYIINHIISSTMWTPSMHVKDLNIQCDSIP